MVKAMGVAVVATPMEKDMESLLTISNITFILGLLAILFSVYNYFRNPQEDLEKRQALTDKEVDNKASVLAQQLQWEKDSNERRFKELNDGLAIANTKADNHIHSLDLKMDNLTALVADMNVRMVREIAILSTKIDERYSK